MHSAERVVWSIGSPRFKIVTCAPALRSEQTTCTQVYCMGPCARACARICVWACVYCTLYCIYVCMSERCCLHCLVTHIRPRNTHKCSDGTYMSSHELGASNHENLLAWNVWGVSRTWVSWKHASLNIQICILYTLHHTSMMLACCVLHTAEMFVHGKFMRVKILWRVLDLPCFGRVSDKKSSDFSGQDFDFRERNFGKILLVYNFVPINWLFISPNYNICRKMFSRPLFQKEAFEIWGCSFVSKKRTRFGSKFPPEWATNSSRCMCLRVCCSTR